MNKKLIHNASRKIAVAPMMDYTDRHFRYLCRLLSPHCWLYTEMVTTGAILYGDKSAHLRYHASEHPLALQLGGSDPNDLAICSQIAEEWGYDEINLNVGCPSDRVQKGRFGACLMKEPDLVVDCLSAMQAAANIPITIKTRIGVDEHDSYDFLQQFIDKVAATGCITWIIHARKAWLKGLSPKENREIPPLHYETVYRIKQDFPHLTILLNGGVKTSHEVVQHLKYVDGVMIGREVYQNPLLLSELSFLFAGEEYLATKPNLLDVLSNYMKYMMSQMAEGVPMQAMSKHLMGLFHKKAGARSWRRFLSEELRLLGEAGLEGLMAKAQKMVSV